MTPIQEIMHEANLSQAEVSRHLGIDPSKVSKFTNMIAPIPKKYLPELAILLSVSPEHIENLFKMQNELNQRRKK